jgi:hypothetical protein
VANMGKTSVPVERGKRQEYPIVRAPRTIRSVAAGFCARGGHRRVSATPGFVYDLIDRIIGSQCCELIGGFRPFYSGGMNRIRIRTRLWSLSESVLGGV